MVKSASTTLILVLLTLFFQKANTQDRPLKYAEQAENLFNLEKYETLVSFCETNMPDLIQKNDSLEIAKLALLQGKAFLNLSKHQKSIESLKLAEKHIPNSQNNNALKADVTYEIHEHYAIKSLIFKELQYGKKSLELYENESSEHKNYERILLLYRRMASPNVTLGNYEVAVDYLNKVDDLLTQIPSDYKLPEPHTNYKVSLGYQKILVDLIETAFFGENYDSLSIKNIAQNVVREKEKLDALYDAHTASYKNKNSSSNFNYYSYVSALNFYSRFFIINKDKTGFNLSDLHDEVDKSIKLLDKRWHNRHLPLYLGNKVDVYRYEKAYNKAMALMDKIIDDAGENHNRYVNFLFQKAQIYFDMSHVEQGRYWIKKGIEKIHSGSDPLKSDYSNFEPGFKLEDVYLLLSVANKIIDKSSMQESLKKKDLSIVYKLAFKQFLNTYTDQPLNKRIQNCFKTIVKNLVTYNCLDQVKVSQIEHVENRLAWQHFSQSRSVVLLPVIDSLEQIDFQLRKQLVKAKKQRKLKQIDSINSALEKYQKQLKAEYPKLANFTQDNFEINEFQNKITSDEMVLKYMFFKEKFALFQITKDTVQWKLYPWESEQKHLLANHLKLIKTPAKKLQLNDSLTQLLLPKAAFKYKVLTIIPDNPIYQLPFETLMYKDRFLIEDKAIRYSSHLRFAYIDDDNFDDDNTKTKVSIFAPEYPRSNIAYTTRSVPYYLEGAQKEAKVIEALFAAVSFTGDEATKQQFVNHKSESTVLHMAMHATIDESNPEFSHFNFSNNEKLYLEELYGLKIPNELAVLSACNTGVGKVEGASGMASLQRALNFAGTKATIASLWEVPDKTTSSIMISFYKHLKQGKTKSEALKRAKQEYLNATSDYKLRHPYYWGGFVLYGDDAPILFKSNSNILYGILALIAVVCVGGFLIRYRKKQVA